MSELQTVINRVYRESKNLLNELYLYYYQNESWLTPQQRRQLQARISELEQIIRHLPRRTESLPYRAIGLVLDAFYNATYALVGKVLPQPRQNS